MVSEQKPSKIRFSEYHLPAIPSGEYELSVSQQLSDKENKIKTQPLPDPVKTKFYISGERFQITPKDIASVFPPASSLGDHSNILPHILLNSTTLPWQRQADPKDDKTPWLTLLVIHEEEEIDVKSQTISLKDAATALNISALEPGQSEKTTLQVLQIKKTLLTKILPPTHHLRYLTHIRESLDEAGNPTGAEYAAIIANRLPKKGGRSTIYLVSLENRFSNNAFHDTIPAGAPQNTILTDGHDDPGAPQNAPLIATADAADAPVTPDGPLTEAADGSSAPDTTSLVQLYSWSFSCPDETSTHGNFTDILKNLNTATSTLRKPDVSNDNINKLLEKGFYPLPHRLRQGPQTASWYHSPLGTGNIQFKTNQPESDSDSFLSYDKDNGMMDVSYAAAWEIGRLLALQNSNFSTELYKWKLQYRKTILKTHQTTKVPHLPGANRDNTPPSLPESVTSWLHDLSLLQGVPFNYLVPDQELLPIESIRFFKLDQAWIYALINGSITIGRVGSSQDHSAENKIFQELKDAINTKTISGFMLRSEVVSGWPGLQVEGYNKKLDDNQQPGPDDHLQLLRNVTLSPSVRLCLFAGDLQTLSLHLKPETLHFGFDHNGAGYSKKWRDATGKEVPDTSIPIELNNGVPDLDKLLAIYKTKDPNFSSSAHLAIQLLEGVDEMRWTI